METFVVGVYAFYGLVSSGSRAIWCYFNDVSMGWEAFQKNKPITFTHGLFHDEGLRFKILRSSSLLLEFVSFMF